jgi:hypothetical protein
VRTRHARSGKYQQQGTNQEESLPLISLLTEAKQLNREQTAGDFDAGE